MRQYVDPDAYKEYRKITDEAAAAGKKEEMTASLRYVIGWMQKRANGNPMWIQQYKTAQKTEAAGEIKNGESGLSEKAAAFLDNLRKTYKNFDFIMGNAGDNLRSLVKNSSKEFSVVFTAEELEKMASDEKYAKEKMNAVHGAVRMSGQINAQFGFERAFGRDTEGSAKMTRFGIAFHDDGSVTYFSELEKSSVKQKERIEQRREKLAEEKKEAAGEREADKRNISTRKVMVEASSAEELIRKLGQVDWSDTKTEKLQKTGSRFDYSI